MKQYPVFGGLQRSSNIGGMPRQYFVIFLFSGPMAMIWTMNLGFSLVLMLVCYIVGKVANVDGGVKSHISFLNRQKCTAFQSPALKKYWKAKTYDPF